MLNLNFTLKLNHENKLMFILVFMYTKYLLVLAVLCMLTAVLGDTCVSCYEHGVVRSDQFTLGRTMSVLCEPMFISR